MNLGLERLADGGMILLSNRTQVALVFGAPTATPAQMAFAIRHTSGFIQVALSTETCDRLLIPESSTMNLGTRVTAAGQCVAVDSAHRITTGISAFDRAETARVLGDPASTRHDLVRPGHLVPVRVSQHVPPSQIAALALELATRAGLTGAVFVDLVNDRDQTRQADESDGRRFAADHGLPMVIIENGCERWVLDHPKNLSPGPDTHTAFV